MSFENVIKEVDDSIKQEKSKRARLKDLDLIVLDNSIRESTVGQLRGHTLENKWKIYNEVKKCGFKFIIVAAFSHMTRVDDKFISELVANGEDVSNLFAFTEVIEAVNDGIPDTKTTPVGLSKMEALGLINPIIEIDLAIESINWDVFTVQDMCKLLSERIKWSRRMLSPDAKIMVNLRDFPDSMEHQKERLFTVVDFLGSFPAAERPFGLLFEEPTGNCLPEEVGAWTAGKMLFYVALLCFALLCFALLCFALLCFALLCFALLCFALLCFALLCFALLCFALLCFALLCFALLCFALLCFALLLLML